MTFVTIYSVNVQKKNEEKKPNWCEAHCIASSAVGYALSDNLSAFERSNYYYFSKLSYGRRVCVPCSVKPWLWNVSG